MKSKELKAKINLELENLLSIRDQKEYKSRLNELLNFAVINNEKDDANLLLPLFEIGADAESYSGNDCRTPLGNAVKDHKLNITKLILAKSANVNSINKLGNGLLHEAINSTNKKISLHNTNIDMVKLLLSYEANPNIKSKSHFFKDQTPLFIAVKIANIEIMELLLDKGANPNALNCQNISVLSAALRVKNTNPNLNAENHHKLIELLLKNGATPNHADKFGISCLDKANMYCKNSLDIVVKLFLQHGLIVKEKMIVDDAIYNQPNIIEYIKSALIARALVETDGIKQLNDNLKEHLPQLAKIKVALNDQGSVEQQKFIDHYLILKGQLQNELKTTLTGRKNQKEIISVKNTILNNLQEVGLANIKFKILNSNDQNALNITSKNVYLVEDIFAGCEIAKYFNKGVPTLKFLSMSETLDSINNVLLTVDQVQNTLPLQIYEELHCLKTMGEEAKISLLDC